MADLVVTCPASFWADWIAEGDAVGDPETGTEWGFTIGYVSAKVAPIAPGDRLYVVAHGRLRGYAPVTGVDFTPRGALDIGRRGGAVAVTLAEPVAGFRGYRRRWWEREAELPFADWRTAGVPDAVLRRMARLGVAP